MRQLMSFCAAAALVISTSSANATLLVYDSYNYTAGANLVGQNGGTGYSGAYAHSDPFNPHSAHTISASTLAYTNLVTAGRAVTAPVAPGPDFWSTTARPFTLPGGVNFGATNGVYYVSYLIRPGTAAAGSFGGLALTNNDSGSSNKPVFIGDTNGFYRVEQEGGAGPSVSSGVVSTANTTTLLVAKYTFNTGNDTVRLYVNPTVGAAEPVTANATLTIATDFLRMEFLDGGRAYQYDEFRLGTTYADVTPAVTALTNTVSLSTAAGAVGSNVAVGGAVHVTGNGNAYISEVDNLTGNSSSAHVQVDNNLDQNAPVYVMIWTESDGVLDSLNVVGGSSIAAGNDQWNNLQAHYGSTGIAGDNFNYLLKFNSNPFGAGAGAVNWDFDFNPNVRIDRIAVVPEPGTMSMLGVAAIGLLGRRRRRPTRRRTYGW